jgi:hypothetical protein
MSGSVAFPNLILQAYRVSTNTGQAIGHRFLAQAQKHSRALNMQFAVYKLAVELVSFDVFRLFITVPGHCWFLGHRKLTQDGSSKTLPPGNIQGLAT